MRPILRRLTTVALTACLSVALIAGPVFASENTDTSPDTVKPILSEAHIRYINGFPDQTMRPERAVTRAEAAGIISNLLENPQAGTLDCHYTDLRVGAWYEAAARGLCKLGLFDDSDHFRPDDAITRAELVDVLVRFAPNAPDAPASFSDVPSDHWAAAQIGKATALGWLSGYPDGTFRPESSLTRAEACAIINRVTNRSGDATQAKKLIGLGRFTDVRPNFWAAVTIAEAAVDHQHSFTESGEQWRGIDWLNTTFTPGIHNIDGEFYSVDRYKHLQTNTTVGAYTADANGVLTQVANAHQVSYVPYISQIDGIQAWVGCEPISSLMGLKAFGYAKGIDARTYLAGLPHAATNPEYGFVGSPYVVDPNKRTTIYPAALATYCNSYCNGATVCADFRGASVQELRQELLAGHTVVAYETLWWEAPRYRTFWIDGQRQSLVYNNHAVLVYGYDPAKGYLISDPYNNYNRGETYQYWKDAATFDRIWNERKVGMVMR